MCIQILVCKCSLECELEILVEQNLIQVHKIALSPQARVIVLARSCLRRLPGNVTELLNISILNYIVYCNHCNHYQIICHGIMSCEQRISLSLQYTLEEVLVL